MVPKDQDKKDSNKDVVTKPVSKNEEKQDSKKTTNNKERDNESSVFEPICVPAPSLGLPYWDCNLNTVIHDNLEGMIYTVRDFVEGYVDENSHPTRKEKTSIWRGDTKPL